MYEPFTLLLSVYARDRAEHLDRAFRSVVHEQSLRPDQVVVVRDGPIGADLEACLRTLTDTSPAPVTLVELTSNVGLGRALDEGLAASRHDVVARMDADDVALPHRFHVQLPLIDEADLVGAGLFEFDEDTQRIVGRRVPPIEPAQILRYARMHDPFNHPTVVYRRQAVLAAGGYGDLHRMEDYALFGRMLDNGARPVNVSEPLVLYRVGKDAFKRRGGAALLRSELRLQTEFRRTRFTTSGQCVRNVVVRGGYRLVPWWLRRALYQRAVPAYTARLSNEALPLSAVSGAQTDGRSPAIPPVIALPTASRIATAEPAWPVAS